jgi:hypothetical protein
MTALPLAALLALASPAASEGFSTELAFAAAASAVSFSADMCDVRRLMRARLPQGARGHSVEDLSAAAATVFGEAGMNDDEQCAVALVIFNRASASRRTVRAVVSEPGQFHGYHGVRNRMECEKLTASVDAVAGLMRAGRCSFGLPRYRYFCSEAGFQRVRGEHRGDPEQGVIHGSSRFRVATECGRNSR